MTLRYLLDTSTVSRAVGGALDLAVIAHLRRVVEEAALAATVWHELKYGLALMPAGRRRNELDEFLREVVRPSYPVLPYDHEASDWHAIERARLRHLGKTPPYADGQIAAIAVVNGLRLVTANVRDFSAFDGLQVEDWSTRR